MFNYLKAPAFIAILAATSVLSLALPAQANSAIKSGNTELAEYSEVIKTVNGKEMRHFKVEYNWDEGATYTHSYNKAGTLIDSHVVIGAPTPNQHEIAQAVTIANAYPDVVEIKHRQAGIDVAGGFPFEAKTGACARPARCLQIFLFDAENVVRHMMVDLRIGKVVIADYIPPQNRGAVE